MRLPVVAVLAAGLLAAAVPAGAQQAGDFGVCLTDSLTGAERKNLAKWIFFSMARHPEFEPYGNVTATDIDRIHEFVGVLMTRLITEDCRDAAAAAFARDGVRAIQDAFRLVGEVAMQELMTNEEVSRTLTGFDRFVDQERINSVFE